MARAAGGNGARGMIIARKGSAIGGGGRAGVGIPELILTAAKVHVIEPRVDYCTRCISFR